MTDLPRFYQGEFGKLDFATMNEIMRRLDILLPLVQSAAAGGGLKLEAKTTLFPVYARKAQHEEEPFDEDNTENKYDWWELTVKGEQVKWNETTEDAFDDEEETDKEEAPATQLRSGSIEEDTYGIVALDPTVAPVIGSSSFVKGFALCMVVQKEAADEGSGGICYLLFPFTPGAGSTRLCMIQDNSPGNSSLSIDGESRQCPSYAGKLLSEDLSASEDCTMIDLNGTEAQNRPTVTGTEPELPYRPYDVGTIMLCNNVGGNKWGFGHLPRFNVVCS